MLVRYALMIRVQMERTKVPRQLCRKELRRDSLARRESLIEREQTRGPALNRFHVKESQPQHRLQQGDGMMSFFLRLFGFLFSAHSLFILLLKKHARGCFRRLKWNAFFFS